MPVLNFFLKSQLVREKMAKCEFHKFCFLPYEKSVFVKYFSMSNIMPDHFLFFSKNIQWHNKLFLLFMAKNEICEICNLPFFCEPFEIFKKFQNWIIRDEKLIGVYFKAFFSKMTFTCCLWRKTKFAKFAICQFFSNQFRYSKNLKLAYQGQKINWGL